MLSFAKSFNTLTSRAVFVVPLFFAFTAYAQDDGPNTGVDDNVGITIEPNTACGGMPPDTGDYNDCCQDHGDHDHISGFVLRYVGPTSPVLIEFNSTDPSYGTTTYNETHSLNDVFLIEANDRFAANSEMAVNGFWFNIHTSCSDPTNVGYGISTNGTLVPNPNENDEDIVFIIDGLATVNDGWCGADSSFSLCNGTAVFYIDASSGLSLSDYSFLWEDSSTANHRDDLCAGTYSVTVSALYMDDSKEFVFTIVDSSVIIDIELTTEDNTVCDEQTGDNNCNCNGYIQEFFFEYTGTPGIGGGVYDEHHDNEYGYWSSLENNVVYSFIVDSPNHQDQYHQHNDPEFWTNDGEWLSFGYVDHSCAVDVVGLSFGPFTIVGYIDINGNECLPFSTNCNGAADVTASNGEAPYTYLWSDGSTAEDRDNLCAGTYQVTVTDNTGCSNALDFVEIVTSVCDCEGNVLDECGVCGGDNSTCLDDCPDGWSYCGEGTTWDPVSKNCVCITSCYGDLFVDGHIQLKDLLELLGVYGTFCD